MHHQNLLSLVALLGLAVPRLISQEAKSSTLPPPTVTSMPTFDVATIKPSKSGDGFIGLRFTPDGFTATNISLEMLLREAYGVENDQII
jgi:hypothetical protein